MSSAEDPRYLPFKDSEIGFDPTDFDSASLSFEIKNTTTHTAVKKDAEVQLVEFLERGAVLEIPARSCSRGHHLTVLFKLKKPNKQEFEFSTTAKVESVENFKSEDQAVPAPEVDQVTVQFVQYDEESWTSFQKHFFSRQDEIESFLKAAKGV